MKIVFFLYSFLISISFLSAEDKEKKWDVARQHLAADTLQFETDEGTWMNLDVSPDGKQIVFDMLGDIYIMSFTGGDAKVLAEGLPYEVQPRFSPNGKKISFTSDRDGGDNIWVMNTDGTEKKAVTTEDFRLLNNAIWTKDGNYLIARKHFTSGRSLGAGEIWMYHHSGGKGLQLTKRKNDQQDVNEPTLSADGKYLYFCEDMYPGGYFQYNKDVHKRVYVVRRLNLANGKIKNTISLNGGAVRPTVSPDGKTIAFIRRVRTKSVLSLYDIESGQVTPLFDGLTKDQQEAWAVFGLYPNFSWTPDGKQIVFWAEGKIWRINVQSSVVSAIPFKVKVKHSIAHALRFKQEVHPKLFKAKMIRHAVTSPDGKTIVFDALGQLWKKSLPDGQTQRLTNSDFREFEPAFSPDGKWIVYATWDDKKFGSISKTRINGGKVFKLTEKPGYYHDPKFSMNGKMIAYKRTTGDRVLGTAYSTKPGIYRCTANGENHQLVNESGDYPAFSKDGQRIYFMGRFDKKNALKSVDLNGKDERVLFTSKYATKIIPSFDEEWIAFQHLFHVYIAPFPKTGQAIDLNENLKSIPLKKVTRDAGRDLHWAWDSKSLHWLIGPEYFSRELKNSFTFVEGAPDSLPAVDSSGIDIGLSAQSDMPSGYLAFKGAKIITMNGDQVINDGIIIIQDNKIKELGESDKISIPSGAKVIDVKGKTIIPGIIDVHAHLANHWSGSGVFPMQDWSYLANLAYGVTTVHDPSTNTEMSFGQAELVRMGKMVGPRVFSTGTILYGADGNFKAVVNSLEDAKSHIRRLKAVGAFSVKSYNQPRRNQRQQIVKAAKELEIVVVPEGGSFFFHNMSMILDGHSGIEHSIPVEPLYNDVIKLWAASKTGYTPTLVVSYGALSGEYYWYQHSNVWEKERLLTFTPRSIIDPRSIRREMAPEEEYGHIQISEAAKKLANAGVKVNLGAHGQLQGLGAHWELWMLAQGGMTALQALKCATINGAHYLGMDHQIGSLEKGKLADLVVLDKNPLENILNTEFVNMVMVNGRLYDAATMNEIGNYNRKRQALYWENNLNSDVLEWHDQNEIRSCSCGLGRH